MSGPSVAVLVSEGLCREFFDEETWGQLGEAAALLGGNLQRADALEQVQVDQLQVLVTSWGCPTLDAGVLDGLPRLALVAHTGASVRGYVTPEVFARGIRVTQAGQAMARPVAEVSLTFTLMLLHRIHRMDRSLHAAGPWYDATRFGQQHELAASRITVVGASRTGRAYLAMLRGLGAEPLLVDPTITLEQARELGAELVGLEEGVRRARVLALHAPSLPETRHLIGARELALLPDGAGVVNTARSWLVDETALLAEVSSGRIDAAIDVFDEEPLPVDSPWRGLPGAILTPHRAAGTVEGRLNQGRIVASEVSAWAAAEPLQHEVTLAAWRVMA
ncbi:MAG: hydroxyacid dehydrogenase [Propionibacteriaceae bacterium]|nr:hydroxyacid dehydrogenase [Propionibacteriaceae bacterium]